MTRAPDLLRSFAVLLVACSLLGACTANGGAIFATIEQEQATISTNLPKTIAAQNVLQVDAAGTTCFIAVAETPYVGVQKTPGSNAELDWTSLAGALPTGATALRSAVALGGKVYAVIAAGDATSLQVAAPDAGLTAAAPALTWLAAAPAGLTADQVPEGLLVVNGELFLSTRDTSLALGHRLYGLGTDAATATDTAVRPTTQVTAGAWDGAAYWFVAGTQLFTGTSTNAMASPTDATIPGSASHAAFGGILAIGEKLYLSTRGGELFMRSGGTWTNSTPLTYPGDTAVLAFSGLGYVENVGNVGGGTVYVGSEGRGFFDLTTAGLPTAASALPAARMPDRTISELYGGVVTHIVALSGVAFVCTAGAGLWHQEVAAGAVLALKGWVWD